MMVLQNVLPYSFNSGVKTLSMVAKVFLFHNKWIPEVIKAKNYGHLCSRKPVVHSVHAIRSRE